MSDPRPTSPPRWPDRLVAVGGVVFLAGVAAFVVQVVARLTGGELPAWWLQLPFLTGVGAALALLGLLALARQRRRQR